MAPLLVVAIAIAGSVFGAEAARGHIVGQLQGLIGNEAAKAVEGLIQSAWRHPHGLLATLLGVGSLLIGASGVFAELRNALNAIGHVKARASGFGALVRARLVAFALVLGFGFLCIATLVLSAVTAAVGAYLGNRWQEVGGELAALLALLDVLLSTAVLVLAFAALLRWLPDTPPSWRAARWGALCSALLFAIGKHLIGLYLARAGVASAYGAAGSLVVVMLWVYYSAQILLFGAALGAAIDRRGG
jgi:membrane protein